MDHKEIPKKFLIILKINHSGVSVGFCSKIDKIMKKMLENTASLKQRFA